MREGIKVVLNQVWEESIYEMKGDSTTYKTTMNKALDGIAEVIHKMRQEADLCSRCNRLLKEGIDK